MHTYNAGLGADSEVDKIIANVMASARALFPVQTSEAEAWIAARLASYGVDYARYKAQQYYGTASEFLSNPIILLGLGLFAGWVIFKR